MAEFRARISRVRMKNGGADIRVIRNEAIEADEEDFRGKIVSNAKGIADKATDEAPLVAYVMLGIYGDGAHSFCCRIPHESCPIPMTLMPAFVAEAVRRYTVTSDAAADQFTDMFQWVE